VDLTFSLLRPDDLVALTVEATNLRLDTGDLAGPRLVRHTAGQPATLTFRFPPQAIAEHAYFEVAQGVTPPPFNPPGDPPLPPVPMPSATEQPDLPGAVDARMSGESRLVFEVPDHLDGIPYTIDGLLDWSRLTLVLPPAARVPAGASQAQGHGPPAIVEPAPGETAIELPYRLLLAPNVAAQVTPAWVHAATPVTHADRTELWHTRLGSMPAGHGAVPAEASADNPLPVRVVWSPDFVADGALPDRSTDNVPFRSSTSAADRDQIVILSAGFSGYTLTTPDHVGHTYVPKPVNAERLFLSALGGWLTSRGSWLFPVTYRFLPIIRPPVHRPPVTGDRPAAAGAAAGEAAVVIPRPPAPVVIGELASLDLVEWDHIATQGRDHYVRIVYEGFLYPFGHRATLVKVTERKVLAPDGGPGFNQAGSPVAYLRQRMFIVVREREKTYITAPYLHQAREMPLAARVRLNVAVTPDIDAPGSPMTGPPGSTNEVGTESFWVTLNGNPYPFPATGRDVAGQDTGFLAPIIFVSLRESQHGLEQVQQDYASDNDRRRCVVRGSKIAYADPAAGDTVLKTTSLYFTSEPVLQAGQPPHPPYVDAPFLPSLDAAAVTVPALAALLGNNSAVIINLYLPFLQGGLDAHAGVFATVSGAGPALSFPADKSGGFSQPNITLSALSARKGLVSGSADDAASGVMRPTAYFGAADAQLFGAIDLGDLIQLVGGLADAAQNAPEIRTHAVPNHHHPTQLNTVINWSPQLAPNPPAGSGVSIAFNAASALTLQVKIEQKLDGTPPSSKAHGQLTNFEVTMSGVIGLAIDKITFDSKNGAKSTVALDLAKQHAIRFEGPLEFVQTIADILPPGLFGGSGPSIKLTPTQLEVSYTLGLPPITCGVFSLTNIAIMAGLDLPYLNGRPAVEFAFASRHRPFLVTVEIFGGGGFVHVVLDAKGVKMVEGAIEFGANFSMDLGVASGSVHAMAGIYFQLKGSSSDLTGFIDIGGEVSVLGIVSISLDLNISLSWQSSPKGNVIEGRATLTISVSVLFFSVSVQLSVERSFSAGGGDPALGQVMDFGNWSQYAAAFG
jgi:hypothetical protein